MVDEVEQSVIGPVEVLEHEHERPLRGCRLEQSPPGRKCLLSLGAFCTFEAHERTRLPRHPFPLLFVLRERLDHRLELLRRGRGVVGLEDPGVRLDDLAQRPEADPLAVGERTALPPGDDLLLGIGDLEQLRHETALADAGNTDERDELRRLLGACPGQRVGE